MSEDEKLGFQIIDKRQFDEVGQPRVGRPLDDASTSFEERIIEIKNTDSSSIEQRSSATAESERKVQNSHNSRLEEGETDVDFSGFVLGMMHQTVIMLGEAPHPETGQIVENIEIARQTIEILAMLEEKTKGNLTEEEERFLKDGVTGLRMAYVAKVREKRK